MYTKETEDEATQETIKDILLIGKIIAGIIIFIIGISVLIEVSLVILITIARNF